MSSELYIEEEEMNDQDIDQVGAVYTYNTNDNEDDDTDDHEHISHHGNDDEEDDDADSADDGLLSYLFNKEHAKQHLFAIFIALIASAISYYHILSDSDIPSRKAHFHAPITKAIERQIPLKTSKTHHHRAFQRTESLFFCPLNGAENGFASLSDNTNSFQKQIQAALSFNGKDMDANDVDPNLQLYQFNFPKEHTDLVNDYFMADERMDDVYNHTLSDEYPEMTDNAQFQCLIDITMASQHKSTVPMGSIAYTQPPFSSFFKNNDGKGKALSVKDIHHGKELKKASLTYTGFTVKFINLSPKPLHLFWDGKEQPKFRSRIQPFEAFTTVTSPGNTFYIAPIYDKDHALERWTVTADEAVLAYDSIANDNEVYTSLTKEHKKLYEMQKLNMKYGQEYLAKTQRSWLSMFPRPMNMHFMWDAQYFGQEYKVLSAQSHFVQMPLAKDRKGYKEIWRQLDYADYDAMAEKKKQQENYLNLKKYREEGPLELSLNVVSVAPRVFEIDEFLSDVEVEHLLDMALIYNATEQPDDEGKKTRKKDGITNAWIRREMSPIVDAIYHRSADIMKIDESLLRHRNEYENTDLNTHHSIAEAMHLTQFIEGQGYFPRSDAKQTSVRNRYQPHRFATVMFFLNDAGEDDGGSTVFPLAVNAEHHDGIRVIPKKGKALLFYNILPDGNADDLSHHMSEFVQKGEKWLGTLFVWDPIID